MNIAVALWKGFFILTTTVLRRGLSKRCKVNYLDPSAHVSPSQPSILLQEFETIKSDSKGKTHSQSVTSTLVLCSHRYGCHKHTFATWIVCQCQSLAYSTLIISSICKRWWYCIPFASLTPTDNPTSMKEPGMKYSFMSLLCPGLAGGMDLSHRIYITLPPCALWRLWDRCRVPEAG